VHNFIVLRCLLTSTLVGVALGCSSGSAAPGFAAASGANGSIASGSGAAGSGAAGSGAIGSGATGSIANGSFDPIVMEAGSNSSSSSSSGLLPDGEVCGTTCPSGQAVCAEETCDGVDNNCDGIIDNVDANHDGVCDCLKIATIGEVGPWGQGNVFTTWLNARSSTPAVALGDQVLTPDLLRPFQVLVSLHVGTMAVSGTHGMTPAHHPFSATEASAFQTWVQSGGGAMTTIGYYNDEAAEVVNVNMLLSPIGMGYSLNAPLGQLNGYVTNWMPHPVTMGVMNVFTQNGVEPAAGLGTPLAYDSGQHLALAVNQVEQGRVVVWGDEWITYDTTWADVTNQQIELFWINILKWLSPPKVCQVPIPPMLPK
jgi:hypothetical protein